MKKNISRRIATILFAVILSGVFFCIPMTVAKAGTGTTAEGLVYDDSYGSVSITGYVGGGGPVVIPDKINGESVVMIDYRAFFACSSVTSVSLPNELTSIGAYAFGECSGLTSLTIPDTVTIIGMRAFEWCTSLKTIKFGQGLGTMGDDVFTSCSGLTSVVLPPLLGNIPESAFSGCTSLTSVTIPAGVEGIGTAAFAGDYDLANVYFLGNAPGIANGAFPGYTDYGGGPTIYKFMMHYYEHCSGFTTPTWNVNSYTIFHTTIKAYSGIIISAVTIKRTSSTTAKVTITADKAGWAYTQCTAIGADPPSISCSGIGDGVVAGTNVLDAHDLTPEAQMLYVAAKDTNGNASLMVAFNLPAYVPKNCTVTFNSMGGSPVASKTALENTKITAPTAPTRAGYHFAGWYRESIYLNAWNFTAYIVTDNMTLYAKWIPLYVVTFNSQGGSPVAGKTVESGSKITAPASPTKTGYSFEGWYKNAECSMDALWDFGNDKVTGNVTLYAHWISTIQYTIKASSSNTAYGTVTGGGAFDTGIMADLKATPKAGHRFVRWKEGTATVSTNYEYKFAVTGNRTLVAEFATIGTPTITVASMGYDRLKIFWAAVPGAAGYEIYRAASATGAYTKITTVTATSYTNTGLTSGTLYYYKVRVKCAAGPAATYGSYSGIKYAKPVPTAPANAKAVKTTSTSIKISWSAVAGATKYEVWRCTTSAGTYQLLTATASLSFTNTGLTSGKYYYYKIRAYRLVSGVKIYGPYCSCVNAKPY